MLTEINIWNFQEKEKEASDILLVWPKYFPQQKRPAPGATIELKGKRLRTLPLAPSPLRELPSQDLQEGDWEPEEKYEDVGPRLEHSPSVQAGKSWKECKAASGGKRQIITFMSSRFLNRLWIPKPWRGTRLPPVSSLPFLILSSLVHAILTCTFWELGALGDGGDTKTKGDNLTLCSWQAIWGHPQCRTATCLWEGFWDRLCWIPHPACSSWGCKPKVHRAGSRNQESSARNSRTQGKDWTQVRFPALLAANSLTAYKPVCSVTKLPSQPVLREKLFCIIR